MAREVAYQTMKIGVATFPLLVKKRSWSGFPIRLGKSRLLNPTHARKEVLALKELILCTGVAKNHDPKRVLYNHY
jgi:hypothetical protein